MASYQNFIATVSNVLVFALRSDDGRYVRLTARTVTVNDLLQNRLMLNLNNDGGQPATLVLKDFPNTDNFRLFIETRNTAGQIQEFPITIVTDELTGVQFLQVDTLNSGTSLRIDPLVTNPSGIEQFVEFRVGTVQPSPAIVSDEFGFLRVGASVSVPKFGFEALLPYINEDTVVNWRPILLFILNGGFLHDLVQRVDAGIATEITGLIVGGIVVPFIINVTIFFVNRSMIDLLNSLARTDDSKARALVANATIALIAP